MFHDPLKSELSGMGCTVYFLYSLLQLKLNSDCYLGISVFSCLFMPQLKIRSNSGLLGMLLFLVVSRLFLRGWLFDQVENGGAV